MISVVLREIEIELRQKLHVGADTLSVRHDRKPPPTVGDQFISLYGTTIAALQPDLNVGIDFGFSVGITITKRTAYNPYETLAVEEYLKDVAGMEAIAYKCIGWVHQSFDLLGKFNTRLLRLNSASPPFIEPFRFKDMDPIPLAINEQWFRPDASFMAAVSPSQTYPYCGMIMEVNFANCRRMLSLTDLRTEVNIV